MPWQDSNGPREQQWRVYSSRNEVESFTTGENAVTNGRPDPPELLAVVAGGSQNGATPFQETNSDSACSGVDYRPETSPTTSQQPEREGVSDSVSLPLNRGSQTTHSQTTHSQTAHSQTAHSQSLPSPTWVPMEAQSSATTSSASPSAAATPEEEEWMSYVRQIYPTLLGGTNFFPPLHFNKVPWTVMNARNMKEERDRLAAVQVEGAQNHHRRSDPSEPDTLCETVSGRVFTTHPGTLQRLPSYQPSDSLDDLAQSTVRQYLASLPNTGSMMVVTQLQFKKYLCKSRDSQLLQRSSKDGDWDVIVIHRRHGLVWGEVKSVGRANPFFRDATREERMTMILTQVKKALKQVKKQEEELNKLVSDLNVKVIKTLFFPFITCTELTEAVAGKDALKDLLDCMGTETVQEAVRRCLCWNDVQAAGVISVGEAAELDLNNSTTSTDSRASSWWQEAVADFGLDEPMPEEVFLRLVGRFCGPATEVEIPTICGPRHRRVLRSEGDSVAETGLIMSRLSLHSQQVNVLVNKPEEDSVYLCGPPGTGKTVVLVLKALAMLREGHEVHILSSSPDSAAVTALIERQLTDLNRQPVPVYRHLYDLRKREILRTVVDDLAAKILSHEGRAFLLVDEITYHVRPNIAEFLELLFVRMGPRLTVWGAGVYTDDPLPSRMMRRELNVSLRCPPKIHHEVRQSERIGGSGHLIPSYESAPGIPAPTEGPEVVWLKHQGEEGHSKGDPEQCPQCGRVIAHKLRLLNVGGPGSPLQWNDVFILSDRLLDPFSPLLQGLRELEVPVTFVPRDADDKKIVALATAGTNTVTLTDIYTVSGLERRVVVGMGNSGFSRCGAMSRCTSQLFWIDSPASV